MTVMAGDSENNPTIDPCRESWLGGLPVSIKRYRYEGKQQVQELLGTQYDRLLQYEKDASEWLLFEVSNETFSHDFLSPEDNTSWSSYSNCENLLLTKIMTKEHAAAIGAFQTALTVALVPMGLQTALQPYPSATVTGEERSKQGDNAWGPRRRPREHDRNWPTVVLEVAVSESQPKLTSDVRFWLGDGRGKVKIVFTLTVDRASPRIAIEKWVVEDDREHRKNKITICRNKNGHTHVTGGPLTIEFESLFLRAPELPREQDIQFSDASLTELTETIWEAQGFKE